jgi:hypothetical protein
MAISHLWLFTSSHSPPLPSLFSVSLVVSDVSAPCFCPGQLLLLLLFVLPAQPALLLIKITSRQEKTTWEKPLIEPKVAMPRRQHRRVSLGEPNSLLQ